MISLDGARIWVTGHRGMVGSALCRRLAEDDVVILNATRQQCDLTDTGAVQRWIRQYKPDMVVHAAAKVGGILANASYPVDFLQENLQIATNVISAAHAAGVQKLVFLGSSCIYPKHAPQPITPDALLSAPLEPTNEWYALAKIAGLKLCQAYRQQYGADFISVMPCNLYGPGDNFDLQTSHVAAALLRRISEAAASNAPTVTLWGSGTPRREFMHVDDLADGVVFALQHYSDIPPLNIGCNADISIRELAQLIAEIVGYKGEFTLDTSKPDGTPKKLMDSRLINSMGWQPRHDFRSGFAAFYKWYIEQEIAVAA